MSIHRLTSSIPHLEFLTVELAPMLGNQSLKFAVSKCLNIRDIRICADRLEEGVGRITLRGFDELLRAEPTHARKLHTLVFIDQPVDIKSAKAVFELRPTLTLALGPGIVEPLRGFPY
jgi:hypothetical protein